MMMHLTGGTLDQCENHYNYLIRTGKMPELKNHGGVQRAQQTTTKRSCIASYSRVLNNEKSLVYIAEANLLSTCLSTISAAKEVAKDAAKEKREQEQKSREGKKAGDRAAFEEKKAELREELENDLKVFDGLGKGKLLNLLKFYFGDKTPNKSKKTHDDLVVLVQLALNERNKERDGTTNDGGIGGGSEDSNSISMEAEVEVEQTGV